MALLTPAACRYPGSLTGTSRERQGSLAVVPLIAYQRYYGEVTVTLL
jgi:hypothetical protein